MSERKSSGLLGGLLIGSALGAVAGLLMAPKTGRETRRLLRKSADALPELAEDLATSVQLQAHRLSDQALNNWDGTLARLKDAVAAGVDAGLQENRRLSRDPQPPVGHAGAPTPASQDLHS
jgi:gas vesicle protein